LHPGEISEAPHPSKGCISSGAKKNIYIYIYSLFFSNGLSFAQVVVPTPLLHVAAVKEAALPDGGAAVIGCHTKADAAAAAADSPPGIQQSKNNAGGIHQMGGGKGSNDDDGDDHWDRWNGILAEFRKIFPFLGAVLLFF